MVHTALISVCFMAIAAKLASSQASCGIRNAILWPWHVNIHHVGQDSDVPACGGTILNEWFVITAGHCVYDLGGSRIEPSELIVTIDRPSVTKVMYARRVIFPNGFDVNKFENDVVLVKLDKSIQFSDEVRPICFSEERDKPLSGSVTIPIEMQQGTTVRTVEWKITDYTSCHERNHNIFNASYDHSICTGNIRDTDKFQLNRGSALMMQRNNVWHLVGILLYTVGPNDNIPTYGGGLVLAAFVKAINKIANRQLSPRISDQKCDDYNRMVPDQENGYFEPYIALLRKRESILLPGCIGTLISENFVLTAATCTQSLERVIMRKDVLHFENYLTFRIHFHPEDIHRKGAALVELNQNVSDMKHFINCLWTNDEHPMAFDAQFNRGSQGTVLDARVRYRPDESVSYQLVRCSAFMMDLTCKPGDVLSTRRDDEKVNRVVGLVTATVEDCKPNTALNVVSYLDWIEDVVWSNGSSTSESDI